MQGDYNCYYVCIQNIYKIKSMFGVLSSVLRERVRINHTLKKSGIYDSQKREKKKRGY